MCDVIDDERTNVINLQFWNKVMFVETISLTSLSVTFESLS